MNLTASKLHAQTAVKENIPTETGDIEETASYLHGSN